MSEVTHIKSIATPVDSGTVEGMIDRLMKQVGERVRQARELKGIPRRALSDKSGVSPRYLAQLESGEGNISIGLLMRVATALDFRIEWLVGPEDPWTSDSLRLFELYQNANPDVRAKVQDLLNPSPANNQRAQRICLVGLRGAGKSTLGKRVGTQLGMPFLELNGEIEDQSGMPVNEVLALYGQEGYRKLEAQALDRIVATHSNLILAVAGGIVAEPETYANLLLNFHTIWVKASPQEHMDRVRAQGDTRPMAGNPEAMEQLKSILTSREILYDKAHAQLDTTGRSIDESLDSLLKIVDRFTSVDSPT